MLKGRAVITYIRNLLILLLFASSIQLYANEPSVTMVDKGISILEFDIEKNKKDKELLGINNDYYISQINHNKALMQIKIDQYKIQLILTKVISILVLILVITGLYLSYLEFKRDQTDGSTFKLNKSGVEFSSSVIGLIILFISLLFFYLFVERIYKIDNPVKSSIVTDEKNID
jgi:hypothetical protein